MKNLIISFIMATGLLGFSALAHEGHHQTPDKLVAHLEFAANGVHAHVYWDKAPTLADAAVMRVEFRSELDHKPTDINADLSVIAHMPEMDHGDIPTAPPVQQKDANGNLKVGVYTIGNVFLYMEGKWEISLTLTSADGSQETQMFELEMAGDGSGNGGHNH